MLVSPTSNLEELDVRDNQLGEQDAIGLALYQAFVAHPRILRTPTASDSDLGTTKLPRLSKSSTVHSMDSHDTRVNDKLRMLQLANNDLGANCIIHLVDALPSFHNLSELVLYHNSGIGERGATALSRLFTNTPAGLPSLRVLNLALCAIGDAGCKSLSTMLRSNDHLRELDVSSNELTDAICSGERSIAEVLSNNSTLERLHLGMNRLRSCGVQQMAYALGGNKAAAIEAIDVSAQAGGGIELQGLSDEVLAKFVGLV